MASLDAIRSYYSEHAEQAYSRWSNGRGIHFGLDCAHPQDHFESLCRTTNFALDLANVGQNQIVVDAGCGTGSLGFEASKRNIASIGLNIVPEQLNTAKNLAIPNAYFLLADYGHPPLAKDSVDAVVFLETLVHSTEKPNVLAAMCEMLKPGGTLVILDYFATHFFKQLPTINKGWAMNIDTWENIGKHLRISGFANADTVDLSARMMASINLAAASCREHLEAKDTATPEVQAHRVGTVAFAEAIETQALAYLAITAQKP